MNRASDHKFRGEHPGCRKQEPAAARACLHRLSGSPVIWLRPHRFQTLARDAVGSTVTAADQAAAAQLAEYAERAVGKTPAVTCDAVSGDDGAAIVLAEIDTPALCERVQRALLML